MMRYVLILLAMLTSAFAALIFAYSWFDDAPPASLAAKIFLAAMIIAYNSLLLVRLWSHAARPAWLPWSIFCGGLLWIAVGSGGFVWTAHLGQITGDWEAYGFVVAMLLVFEGALATVQVLTDEANTSKLIA